VEKRLYVNVSYHMENVDPVWSRNCGDSADLFDQDWPGQIAGDLQAQILFRKRIKVYSKVGHKLRSINYLPGEPVTGPTTDFGDFSYGDLPYDSDKLGRHVLPAPGYACFGATIDLRMIPGTARFVVTAKERALLVKVRVMRFSGPGTVCEKSIATLKMVDSEVTLGTFTDAPGLFKAPSTTADSFSITGFAPACPHEHSWDMKTPAFFPPLGRPANWVGPYALLRVTLTCWSRLRGEVVTTGISEKECPVDFPGEKPRRLLTTP
jgi:hypothetical protein